MLFWENNQWWCEWLEVKPNSCYQLCFCNSTSWSILVLLYYSNFPLITMFFNPCCEISTRQNFTLLKLTRKKTPWSCHVPETPKSVNSAVPKYWSFLSEKLKLYFCYCCTALHWRLLPQIKHHITSHILTKNFTILRIRH